MTRRSGDGPETQKPPDVLTVAEAAERLRVSLKTVYSAVKHGQLPVLRFGRTIRIPSHAFQKMLDEAGSATRRDDK